MAVEAFGKQAVFVHYEAFDPKRASKQAAELLRGPLTVGAGGVVYIGDAPGTFYEVPREVCAQQLAQAVANFAVLCPSMLKVALLVPRQCTAVVSAYTTVDGNRVENLNAVTPPFVQPGRISARLDLE